MASESTRIVRRTAASLSYEELKHEQEKAVVLFIEGRVLLCIGLLLHVFDLLRGKEL